MNSNLKTIARHGAVQRSGVAASFESAGRSMHSINADESWVGGPHKRQNFLGFESSAPAVIYGTEPMGVFLGGISTHPITPR